MVDRLPLNMIDTTGGVAGQVPIIDPTGKHFYFGSASSADLPWFNVKTYGATGVAGDDATSAINDTIDALIANGGGRLYYPYGQYDTTGDLHDITVPCMVFGDGASNVYDTAAATTITSSSNSLPLLTIAGHAMTVQGIHFKSTAGTTPISGSSGLLVTAGDGCRYRDLSFDGFYIDMDVQDGAEWYMSGCFFYGPVQYGLKIRHIDLPDGGDMGIFDCQFIATTYNSAAAIRFESGGGLRLVGCKVNYRSGHQFTYGLDATITAATGVMTVIGCSMENTSSSFIHGRVSGSGTFQAVSITGNEFAYYSPTTASAVDIDTWGDVSVVGNTFLAQFGGSTGPAVKLANVTKGAVGLNTNDGFTAEYTLTSCTGITTVPTGASTLVAKDEGTIIDSAVTSFNFVGSAVAATTDGAGHVTVTVTAAGLRPLTTESGGVPDFVWDDNNELVMTEAPG